MANKIARMRDSGVPLVVTVTEGGVFLDISAATLLQILLRRPHGGSKRLTAAFVNTGTDGQITATTDATTFDVEGDWLVQAHVVTPAFNIRSDADTLTIQAAAE